MAYFSQGAYETLLRKVRTGENPDDLQIIWDATDDFIQYVRVVSDGESRLNTAASADRAMVGDYDAKRHNAHENAISSASVLNRLSGAYENDPVFTGDTVDRHQVAAFCLEIVSYLFENRRRVL